MGEPGPLSPDDRERLREDRLRLVWSRDACLVIFRNRELLFLLQNEVRGGLSSDRGNSTQGPGAGIPGTHPGMALAWLRADPCD